MAIEVVDSKPHPSVVREKICSGCGSTLRFTPNDIKTEKSYDYTGDWYVYSIRCPQCNTKLGVKAP